MIITVSYDSSVNPSSFTNFAANGFASGAAEEAAFKSAITYVINELDSLFTNPVTMNITVGWGEAGGAPLKPNAVGENLPTYDTSVDYSTISSGLVNTADLLVGTQPVMAAAAATLPSSNPLPGGFAITTAEEKALEIFSGSPTAIDDKVGFNSSVLYSFTPGAAVANEFDFIAVAEHEITEGMGRVAGVGSQVGGNYTPMDLFRYSAPGVRDTSAGPITSTAYFSYDNGTTDLGNWNNYASAGDLGDWFVSFPFLGGVGITANGPAPKGNDAFAAAGTNVLDYLTTTDVTLMNVLGWDTAVPPNYTVPNGVAGWVPSPTSSYTTISSGVGVESGGYFEVGSGGVATSTTIANGGSARIDSGGTANSTTVIAAASRL